MNKLDLRNTLKDLRSHLSLEYRDQAHHQILQNLKHLFKTLDGYDFLKTVGLYCAKPDEVQTNEIDDFFKHNDIFLLYPCIDLKTKQILFRYMQNDQQWEMGPFQIPEPSSSYPEGTAEIYFVPLLGFNKYGYRLGYGLGHYDRYFAALKSSNTRFLTIGLAYSCQFIDDEFQEEYDYPLDYIITEDRIYKFIS